MSSLALIDAMLSSLGENIESNESVNETNKTTFGGDAESKLSDECDLSLTLRGIPEYENYPYNLKADKFLFMADIKAPLFKKTIDRASIDLVCVIDESGSMQGDRIKLVQETVEFIIKNLEPNDRFGIIGFATNSREILKLTKMNNTGKQIALNECNKFTASGCTALSNGLLDGIKMLKDRDNDCNKNKIASVMLFTDGKANRGITNKIKILNEMDKYMLDNNQNDNDNDINIKGTMGNDKKKEKETEKEPKKDAVISIEGKPDDNECNEGDNDEKETKKEEKKEEEDIFSCSINTFGFGKDHNASLLEEIAERGNGMYSFIETQEYISETFAEALGGLISVCGQNLNVTIKAVNDVKINKCLSKRFKKKEIIKNKMMQIIIPDIQSEERRSLVFELNIPSMIEMDEEKKEKEKKEKKDVGIIEFNVEYNNVITDKKELLTTICSINRINGNITDIGERNLELDIQNNRIIAADAMQRANNLAMNNQLNEARKIIKNAQNIIKTSRSSDDTYCATLIHDLEQCLTKLVSQYEYASSGRQYMMMNSMSHYTQRSTQSTNLMNISQSSYTTTARYSMMNNFVPNINTNQKKK